MSLHELELPANVIDVSFNADASLIAVLHLEGVAVFKWADLTASSAMLTLRASIKLSETNCSKIIHTQIAFFGLDEILILQQREARSRLRRFDFDDKTGEGDMMELDIASDFVPKMVALSSFCEGPVAHAFVQGSGGELMSLGVGEYPLHQVSFSTYLPWVEIWEKGAIHIPFGMSNNGQLYAQSRLLVKNCTSFLVTPAHLIFTTTTHLLKFVHITDSVDGKPMFLGTGNRS
jgi:elongator complex protein 1